MAGYGTDEGFAGWLSENGHTLPGDAPLPAVLRQRGSSYVDAVYGSRFSGVPLDAAQDRAWPRTGASIFGQALATDLIPNRVVNASYEAAWIEARAPGSLSVVTDPAKRVKRQKVDTIEREFFEPGADGGSTAPVSSTIEGMLAPLLHPVTGVGVMVV